MLLWAVLSENDLDDWSRIQSNDGLLPGQQEHPKKCREKGQQCIPNIGEEQVNVSPTTAV